MLRTPPTAAAAIISTSIARIILCCLRLRRRLLAAARALIWSLPDLPRRLPAPVLTLLPDDDVLLTDVLPADVLPAAVLPADVLPVGVLPAAVLPVGVPPADVLPADVLLTDVPARVPTAVRRPADLSGLSYLSMVFITSCLYFRDLPGPRCPNTLLPQNGFSADAP